MTSGTDLTILVALAAGLISFLSPCVLPLVPAYLGQLSAIAVAGGGLPHPGRWLAVRHAIAFVFGFTAVFALLGGTWFPITGGVMQKLAEALPSYWLVQASRVGLGEHGWGSTGWLVVAAWTVGAAVLAARAYSRDTQKV